MNTALFGNTIAKNNYYHNLHIKTNKSITDNSNCIFKCKQDIRIIKNSLYLYLMITYLKMFIFKNAKLP